MRKSKRVRRKKILQSEFLDYDTHDTSSMIDASSPLKLEDIGLKLSDTPPTQVVSIRLPSWLLNELRAIGSQQDVPYQALVKLFLAEAVTEHKKKHAA